MKICNSLAMVALVAVTAVAFAACGGSSSQTSSSVNTPTTKTAEPESNPANVVKCYDAKGNTTAYAAALSVDSIKIVYEHQPSEIVLAVHNHSGNLLGNIKGVISLYGADGQKYDSVDFSKSAKIAAGETGSENVYLGDKRVHPNQEWNRDVALFFAPTGPNRFSFIGSDNNWCECIAKVVEVRIESYEVFD